MEERCNCTFFNFSPTNIINDRGDTMHQTLFIDHTSYNRETENVRSGNLASHAF